MEDHLVPGLGGFDICVFFWITTPPPLLTKGLKSMCIMLHSSLCALNPSFLVCSSAICMYVAPMCIIHFYQTATCQCGVLPVSLDYCRIAKYQIFYTEKIFQKKFYPKKST